MRHQPARKLARDPARGVSVDKLFFGKLSGIQLLTSTNQRNNREEGKVGSAECQLLQVFRSIL